jgi:hypothetical protein
MLRASFGGCYIVIRRCDVMGLCERDGCLAFKFMDCTLDSDSHSRATDHHDGLVNA